MLWFAGRRSGAICRGAPNSPHRPEGLWKTSPACSQARRRLTLAHHSLGFAMSRSDSLIHFHVHMISDSTGETLMEVMHASVAQFENVEPIEHLFALVRSPKQLERALEHIALSRHRHVYAGEFRSAPAAGGFLRAPGYSGDGGARSDPGDARAIWARRSRARRAPSGCWMRIIIAASRR
jgi:hypothetical protein